MSDNYFDGVEDDLARKALDTEETQEQYAKEKEYEFWNEEETPLLKCVLEKVTYVRDKWNKVIPILIVKDVNTNEHLKIWASRTVLRTELEQLKPAVGSPLAIQCMGKVEGKQGAYYLYSAVAESSDEGVWNTAEAEFWVRDEKRRKEEAGKPAEVERTSYGPDEAPF